MAEKKGWTVEYNNDVGPRDKGFWEWWEILFDGVRVFKADKEEDAIKLVCLLKDFKADRNLDLD